MIFIVNIIFILIIKLEEKGYIKKDKASDDERNLVITLTESGTALREQALFVPGCMAKEFSLTPDEAAELYRILYKMLEQERTKENEEV